LTSDESCDLVAAIIEELKSKGARICSIVGDDLLAQVSALAHWSKKPRLRGVNPYLNGIRYSPCMCHFMQLMIDYLIANGDNIEEFEARLQGLIDWANSSEASAVLRYCEYDVLNV
jgi:chemotaxis receptor (MCP) glutamine deamidase CheD